MLTMKNLLMILALIGSLGMVQGQIADHDPMTENSLDDRSEGGEAYLRRVQSPITPNSVRQYQIMAVDYDVAKLDLFDGRNELFLVAFKTQKGTILTSYDRKGEVVESVEKFRDLALPLEIMRTGLKSHAGWAVIRTNYYVSYVKDQRTEIIYTIQITDGIKKKKILLDGDGTLLD